MGLNLASSLSEVLNVDDQTQVGHARRTTQRMAEQQGFDPSDAGRVALVTTELASNLLKHAGHGELHLRYLPRDGFGGVEVIAIDRGAGFDLHNCLTDGFSTGGTQGIGLGAVVRQADVFDHYADARGSVLLTRFYPRGRQARDLRYGVSQHSLHNDPACGDSWQLSFDGPRISALVIDGLGHGELAEAASRAGAAAFALAPFADPSTLMEDLHAAMSGTRGGAGAFAQYNADSDSLSFSGIGNIGASLVAPGKTRGMPSHPGIIGGQFRRARPFDYAHVSGDLLILYSDGLQSRWNLTDYPGLVQRHPAVVCSVLHRDFCRGRDDVTVLAVALEKPRG